MRSDSDDSTETESQEYLARRINSDYRDDALEKVENTHSRKHYATGVDTDDNDENQGAIMELRDEISQPQQNPEPLGAPNLFNLPNLSENKRKDIHLLEGDIAMSRGRNAFQLSGKWSGGIVPYEFSSGYTTVQQNTIKAAMATISSATNNCIKFVPRGSNPVWLRIYPGQGTKDSGAQDVSLQQPGCVYEYVAIHEFLHALGFAHEQTRPDRDKYVTVYPENIITGVNGGFSCGTDGLFANPFDASSYFQCKSGMATLTPCSDGRVWNQDKQFCHWKPAKVNKQRYLIVAGGDTQTGKCLDIAGGKSELHAQIQLFRCHGNENQQFELNNDNTLRVMGKCLDIPDSNARDHQYIQLFTCRPEQQNQQYSFDQQDRIHVMGKCLDVPNGNVVNNNPLQLFRCHNQQSQRFTLIPVS
ncbi:unnamed protein product [Rotaria sp. Silwood1]|nr:unnamed protein product [Rotaria sp. Silwood1]CAF3712929.1 unnamed protein product [Rotaria sp. Silwood1]CAF4608284.1 unnamed protein product [Rotaria sp. Silwood1]